MTWKRGSAGDFKFVPRAKEPEWADHSIWEFHSRSTALGMIQVFNFVGKEAKYFLVLSKLWENKSWRWHLAQQYALVSCGSPGFPHLPRVRILPGSHGAHYPFVDLPGFQPKHAVMESSSMHPGLQTQPIREVSFHILFLAEGSQG